MSRWGRHGDAAVVVMGAAAAVAAIVVVATGALLVSDYRPVGGEVSLAGAGVQAADDLHDSHERAIVVLVAASAVAAAAALRRRRQGRWGLTVAVVASVAAALTWPLVQWDQLALWAVTVPGEVSGFWAAAFGDDVRFVIMDQSEVSQGEYAAAAAVHVVAPVVALAALAAAFLRRPRAAAEKAAQPALVGSA